MKPLYLEATGLKKSYGLRLVIDAARLEVYEGARIGLVGANGAGKSTLLKLLLGEIEPDEGVVRRLCGISMIDQQHAEFLARQSAAEDAPNQAPEFRALAPREGLSGGEKTRIRIADALSRRAHVLLADEPTTDLDAEGVRLLAERLRAFSGALILVSHDRALLDDVATEIWALEAGKVTVYPGNYTAYRQEEAQIRAFQQFEYEQYRAEQSRLRKAIQGKREHASQVMKLPDRMGNSEARLHKRSATEVEEKLARTRKALESRLSHLEVKERPTEDPEIRMAFGGATPVLSKTALAVNGMTIRFGARALLENACLRLPTGSHTALLGPNGCGKTTLVQRLVGGRDPRVIVSPGVKIGYFGQEHEAALSFEQTALENVRYASLYPEHVVRTILARMQLGAEDADKKVSVLSGGERAKVALARLLVSDVNALVLDEATNHLDIFSLEALGELLRSYAGTLLFVSHDRRIVEQCADRLILFERQTLTTFEGPLAEYERARNTDEREAERRLRRTALTMKMAELSGKLAGPIPGKRQEERRAALVAEYDSVAAALRQLDETAREAP